MLIPVHFTVHNMMQQPGHAKSARKRLQRQLEFYLSASNLRQDKFLRQHMDEDGFLPASLFLSFNKMKELNASEKLILEVATKSDVIRVDTTCSGIAPVDRSYEEASGAQVDERTIYIEGYDAEAHDHESLRRALAVFGKIAYVSMPRFPHTRRFKGFAFVEFASTEAATQALEKMLTREEGEVREDELAGLAGVRAMSKRQWLDIKNKLKAQLNATTGHAPCEADHPDTTLSYASPAIELPPAKASGHVRFREEAEEDAEENPRTKHPKT